MMDVQSPSRTPLGAGQETMKRFRRPVYSQRISLSGHECSHAYARHFRAARRVFRPVPHCSNSWRMVAGNALGTSYPPKRITAQYCTEKYTVSSGSAMISAGHVAKGQ